jgi:Phospholipase_D-nuclease N-terminal
MGLFWWLLGVAIVAIWVLSIIDIVRKRHVRSGGATAAWIIVVLVFPIVGTLIYYMVNAGGAGPRGTTSSDEELRPTPRRF